MAVLGAHGPCRCAHGLWRERQVPRILRRLVTGQDGISSDPDTPTIAGASAFFLENQLFLFQGEANAPASPTCSRRSMVRRRRITARWRRIWSEGDHRGGGGPLLRSSRFKAAAQSVDAGRAAAGAATHEASCAHAATPTPARTRRTTPVSWPGSGSRTWSADDDRLPRRPARCSPRRWSGKWQALSDADIEALSGVLRESGPVSRSKVPARALRGPGGQVLPPGLFCPGMA
jgi:hypothetical protein